MKKKSNEGVYAAIAMALYELSGDLVHDNEEMKLTIRRGNVASAWALKTNLLRKDPSRHF